MVGGHNKVPDEINDSNKEENSNDGLNRSVDVTSWVIGYNVRIWYNRVGDLGVNWFDEFHNYCNLSVSTTVVKLKTSERPNSLAIKAPRPKAITTMVSPKILSVSFLREASIFFSSP